VELPRADVADYLEQIDPSICARYIMFLIEERGEVSSLFHDRLAELYLSMTSSAKKRGDDSVFLSSQGLAHSLASFLFRIMEKLVFKTSAIH
jgi:hypothetical protein